MSAEDDGRRLWDEHWSKDWRDQHTVDWKRAILEWTEGQKIPAIITAVPRDFLSGYLAAAKAESGVQVAIVKWSFDIDGITDRDIGGVVGVEVRPAAAPPRVEPRAVDSSPRAVT